MSGSLCVLCMALVVEVQGGMTKLIGTAVVYGFAIYGVSVWWRKQHQEPLKTAS